MNLDLLLYAFAAIGCLWFGFVVTPVLLAPNYKVMEQRWEETAFANQVIGFVVTILTIIALIVIVIFTHITGSLLSGAMKMALVAPVLVTISFFVIYIRSCLK